MQHQSKDSVRSIFLAAFAPIGPTFPALIYLHISILANSLENALYMPPEV
jgi:hypothetical protein